MLAFNLYRQAENIWVVLEMFSYQAGDLIIPVLCFELENDEVGTILNWNMLLPAI